MPTFYKLFVNVQLIDTKCFKYNTDKDKSFYLCMRCENAQKSLGENCQFHIKLGSDKSRQQFTSRRL